jgi:hypothetical protein
MICSSLNRDRFIVRTPLPVVGLYPNLEEFAGLRSMAKPTTNAANATTTSDR